jgi:hypothetical protein
MSDERKWLWSVHTCVCVVLNFLTVTSLVFKLRCVCILYLSYSTCAENSFIIEESITMSESEEKGKWICNCSTRILGILPVACMQPPWRVAGQLYFYFFTLLVCSLFWVMFPFSSQSLCQWKVHLLLTAWILNGAIYTTQLPPWVAVGGFLLE